MSVADAARRELGKVYITAQVGFGILFYAVAERTGRSYETVANLYAERASETLVAWVMSLPTWAGVVVVLLPLATILLVRIQHLMTVAAGAVRRHGLLRTIAYAGAAAIVLAVVAEERPDLLAAAVGVRER